MRYKHILIELSWLASILIVSGLLIIINFNKSGISINLHDTYYFIPQFAIIAFGFVLLAGLIYFIKEFPYKFKRSLQKWIAYTTVLLSCIILIVISYIYGGFIDAIRNIYTADSMRSPLIPENVPNLLVSDAYYMFTLATLRTVYILLFVLIISKSRRQPFKQSS